MSVDRRIRYAGPTASVLLAATISRKMIDALPITHFTSSVMNENSGSEKTGGESVDVERIRHLMGDLRAWLDRGKLSAGDRARLREEIDALTEQLDKAAPSGELRPRVMRISELVRNAEDWVATSGIIQAIEAAIGI